MPYSNERILVCVVFCSFNFVLLCALSCILYHGNLVTDKEEYIQEALVNQIRDHHNPYEHYDAYDKEDYMKKIQNLFHFFIKTFIFL